MYRWPAIKRSSPVVCSCIRPSPGGDPRAARPPGFPRRSCVRHQGADCAAAARCSTRARRDTACWPTPATGGYGVPTRLDEMGLPYVVGVTRRWWSGRPGAAAAAAAPQRQAPGDAAPHQRAAGRAASSVSAGLAGAGLADDQLARVGSNGTLKPAASPPSGCATPVATRARPAAAPAVVVVQWPADEIEPTKYWLSTLPERARRNRTNWYAAHQRWRIERDYQDLAQDFGWATTRAWLARISSPCFAVHCGLRVPDGRTTIADRPVGGKKLRSTPSACPSRRLHPRGVPARNVTCRIRYPACATFWLRTHRQAAAVKTGPNDR